MKNYITILGLVAILSGCAEFNKYITVSSAATPEEKFRACALSEAQSKLQNGTLFTKTMTATKDEIVNTCIKKLALEAVGIDSEAQNITSNIINSLQSLSEK